MHTCVCIYSGIHETVLATQTSHWAGAGSSNWTSTFRSTWHRNEPLSRCRQLALDTYFQEYMAQK